METSEADGGGEAPKARRVSIKLLVLGMLLVLGLLGGAGAAAWLSGMVPWSSPAAATAVPDQDPVADIPEPAEIQFVDMPDMVVNLNVDSRRLRFLKFGAALEVLGETEAAQIERFLPRIIDNVHMYLRSFDPEQLSGPQSVYGVKVDLIARINQVVAPAEIRDVLIKEMLIQ